jgi:hypothetical protein
MKNNITAAISAGLVFVGINGCSSSSGGGQSTNACTNASAIAANAVCAQDTSGPKNSPVPTTCTGAFTKSVDSCPTAGNWLGSCLIPTSGSDESSTFYYYCVEGNLDDTAASEQSSCVGLKGSWTAGSVAACGDGGGGSKNDAGSGDAGDASRE